MQVILKNIKYEKKCSRKVEKINYKEILNYVYKPIKLF